MTLFQSLAEAQELIDPTADPLAYYGGARVHLRRGGGGRPGRPALPRRRAPTAASTTAPVCTSSSQRPKGRTDASSPARPSICATMAAMAQNVGGARPNRPETLPGTVLEDDTSEASVVDPADIVEDIASVDDFGAIDKLLEATDHGWGLEEQVLSLQQVAADPLVQTASMARTDVGGLPCPRSGHRPRSPRFLLFAPHPSRSLPIRLAALPNRRPSARPQGMADPGALVDLLHSVLLARQRARERGRRRRSGASPHGARHRERIHPGRRRARPGARGGFAPRLPRSSSAAHAMLRRKKHGRGSAGRDVLAHLRGKRAREAATNEQTKVELLAEKARLLEAAGNQGGEVRVPRGTAR